MRIRLSFTIHITRDRDAPDPEPDNRPAIYDMSSAHIERATEPDPDRPIGFSRHEEGK